MTSLSLYMLSCLSASFFFSSSFSLIEDVVISLELLFMSWVWMTFALFLFRIWGEWIYSSKTGGLSYLAGVFLTVLRVFGLDLAEAFKLEFCWDSSPFVVVYSAKTFRGVGLLCLIASTGCLFELNNSKNTCLMYRLVFFVLLRAHSSLELDQSYPYI